MKLYRIVLNGKSFVSNYNIFISYGEIYIDTLECVTSVNKKYIRFFDKEYAINLSNYIKRCYNFDVYVEEIKEV